eukprot:jgi/Chlat1/5625/Chrsp369S00870
MRKRQSRAARQRAQHQVLDNADLLRAILSNVTPRHRARASCVSRVWREAATEAEDDYYRSRWPHAHEALKDYVNECHKLLNSAAVVGSSHEEEDAPSFLAFCTIRHGDSNLLVPKSVDDRTAPAAWHRYGGNYYLCFYKKGSQHMRLPATDHSLQSFVHDAVFDVFVFRRVDGELLHIKTHSHWSTKVLDNIGLVFTAPRFKPEGSRFEFLVGLFFLDFGPGLTQDESGAANSVVLESGSWKLVDSDLLTIAKWVEGCLPGQVALYD